MEDASQAGTRDCGEMISSRQDGYVLASALAVLFALSLTAVVLLWMSVDGLSRAKAAETTIRDEAALQSAIFLVGAQLSLDPLYRTMDLREGAASFTLSGREVSVTLSWESDRLDLNQTSADDVDLALRERVANPQLRERIVRAIRIFKARGGLARLLDDLELDPASIGCANAHLSVFGGRKEFKPGQSASPGVARPGAGARLRLSARNRNSLRGLDAVVIMTGSASTPFRVLDWRHITSTEDPCHAP
jgi:hypothetical protein